MRGKQAGLKAFGLAAALGTMPGCLHAIPLGSDPFMPMDEGRASPQELYRVDWWQKLVTAPGLIDRLEVWPSETAAPAIDPETQRVYVGTRDGHFRCLSPLDGSVEWDVALGGRMYAGATVHEGIVYVPAGDGMLHALKARTGEELWAFNAKEELVAEPVIEGNRALVVTQSNTLFAVDLSNGVWKWQYKRDLPSGFSVRGASRPVVKNGLVYAGFADGVVAAIGLNDGVARFETKITRSSGQQFLDVDTPPVLDELGNLYVASYKDGVAAIDAKNGNPKWFSKVEGVTSLQPRGDVLFTAGSGKVGAVLAADGHPLWSLELSEKGGKKGSNAGQAPLVTKSYLVVPTSTGLVFVDPMTGSAKSSWNPGRGVTATPARLGSRLYVLANTGDLFALHLVGGG